MDMYVPLRICAIAGGGNISSRVKLTVKSCAVARFPRKQFYATLLLLFVEREREREREREKEREKEREREREREEANAKCLSNFLSRLVTFSRSEKKWLG
jgi:hypothetical protein